MENNSDFGLFDYSYYIIHADTSDVAKKIPAISLGYPVTAQVIFLQLGLCRPIYI